jgi:hypothetical protein
MNEIRDRWLPYEFDFSRDLPFQIHNVSETYVNSILRKLQIQPYKPSTNDNHMDISYGYFLPLSGFPYDFSGIVSLAFPCTMSLPVSFMTFWT